MSPEDVAARIHRVRDELADRTSEMSKDPAARIARAFFLSVLFPQVERQARKDPHSVRNAIAEIVANLCAVMGLGPEDIFPDGTPRIALPPSTSALADPRDRTPNRGN